jgi:hypothetical protein
LIDLQLLRCTAVSPWCGEENATDEEQRTNRDD